MVNLLLILGMGGSNETKITVNERVLIRLNRAVGGEMFKNRTIVMIEMIIWQLIDSILPHSPANRQRD